MKKALMLSLFKEKLRHKAEQQSLFAGKKKRPAPSSKVQTAF